MARVHFLGRLGAGFGTVALAALDRFEAGGLPRRAPIDPMDPFAPRQPDFRPRAKSVIVLFLVGGPSQIDTFDYKPVPESLRKAVESMRHANVLPGCKDGPVASPFQWSRHGESGL